MKHFAILIRPRGPLLIGGRTAPRAGGDRASARDHEGRLVIPGSALRGALRLEMERLLRAVGEAVCSAGAAPAGDPQPCTCQVCRLFGTEGVALGRLRLGDATAAVDTTSAYHLRPQVGVGRRTGTAVAQHLAFSETGVLNPAPADDRVFLRAPATLVPLGPDDPDATLDEDLNLLKGACRAIRAIGGGKARGLGWVECEIEEPEGGTSVGGTPSADGTTSRESSASQAKASPEGAPAPPRSLLLTFKAEAPLHFGRGRPLGSFHPTRRFAPASTVRGAIAYALLEHRLCRPEDSSFQRLVDPDSSVTFGSARPVGDRPLVTRRTCRGPDEHVFDDLPSELFLRLANRAGAAVTMDRACPHPGCPAPKATPGDWPADTLRPRVRLRTKTALNRHTGTAMDQRLYSMEVLEPVVEAPGTGVAGESETGPLRLQVHLSGLGEPEVALLRRLDGRKLWLGGKRSRGLGRAVVEVADAETPEISASPDGPRALTRSVEPLWQALRKVEDALPANPFGTGQAAFGVVLVEPWLPEDPTRIPQGPLASGDGGVEAEAVERFIRTGSEGRFGSLEATRWRAPSGVRRGEVPSEQTVAPGSMWVYRLAEERLEAAWAELRRAGLHGTGRNRELGWGRYRLWTPEETVS